MQNYNSLPWYKKLVNKKPLPFTDKEPTAPKIKTGPYFMPNNPEIVYKRAEDVKDAHRANIAAYYKHLKKKNKVL